MKVFLETYGCQMNDYDSELVRSVLQRHDYEFTDAVEQAEVILLNTCAVRENAQVKIYQRINDFKSLKHRGKARVIGILGCMAQSLRQKLAESMPAVDIVAGPDSYKKLPELIRAVIESGEKGYEFSLSEFETYEDIAPMRLEGINAWIAIMRGCDNFCTYCIVPYTRGRERSRPAGSIVAEASQAVAQGFPQITLLGQNVNSYRYEQCGFAQLMELMTTVAGLRRVRFAAPHPKDFSRQLLHVMAQHPQLCKHIHLPLQAGSDAVLERMGRTYTQKEFLDLVADIRHILPGVSLTTDLICGFCGETTADFQKTLETMAAVRFDAAFIFKYSVRPNTIAACKYPDDVSEEAKTERTVQANELQRRISKESNEAEVGKTYEVLIENESKKNQAEWLGRTDHNKCVVFSAPNQKPGDFVTVEITGAGTHTLLGKLVGK